MASFRKWHTSISRETKNGEIPFFNERGKFCIDSATNTPSRPILFSCHKIFQTVCVRLLEQLTIVKDADESYFPSTENATTLPSNCVRRFFRYCLSRNPRSRI